MHCTRFDTREVILAVVFQCERIWLPHILGILSCVGYIDQWSTPKVLTDRHFLKTGRCIECCTTCPRDLKQYTDQAAWYSSNALQGIDREKRNQPLAARRNILEQLP